MADYSKSIIFLGATGAVGTQVLKTLLQLDEVQRITLLGRRAVEGIGDTRVEQHHIDIFKPETYTEIVSGHDTAICTLGVGQPSKMSKENFVKIDKTAVLDFAKAAKAAGVRHFELLSSVGIDADSRSFYLRTKGELVEALKALDFERLSIFQPSMILTPSNRYGIIQGITLKIWPLLHPLLNGSWKKFRGIKVERLGSAMARNLLREGEKVAYLSWQDFQKLS